MWPCNHRCTIWADESPRHKHEAIIAKGLALPLYMRDIQAQTLAMRQYWEYRKRRVNPEYRNATLNGRESLRDCVTKGVSGHNGC